MNRAAPNAKLCFKKKTKQKPTGQSLEIEAFYCTKNL